MNNRNFLGNNRCKKRSMICNRYRLLYFWYFTDNFSLASGVIHRPVPALLKYSTRYETWCALRYLHSVNELNYGVGAESIHTTPRRPLTSRVDHKTSSVQNWLHCLSNMPFLCKSSKFWLCAHISYLPSVLLFFALHIEVEIYCSKKNCIRKNRVATPKGENPRVLTTIHHQFIVYHTCLF